MIDPILPLYASSFNISYTTVGLVISSFGFARIFSEMPGGLLADRIGRKRVILMGSVLCGFSYLSAGLAQGFIELMFSRMVIGCGSALMFTAGLVYVGEMATKVNRTRFMARYQSTFFIGGIIGPTIGGLISERFNLRTNFFVSAAFSAIGIALALLIKEYKVSPKPGKESHPISVLTIVKDVRIMTLSVSCLLLFLLYSSVNGTIIPLWGVEELGLNSLQIGFLLSLSSAIVLVVLTVIPRLEKILRRSSLLVTGLIICSIGMFLISFASNFLSLSVFLIPFGVGLGLVQSAPFALLIDYTKPEERGLAMGIFRTVGDFGMLVGPMMVGFLMDIGSVFISFNVLAIALGVFSFLVWRVFRRPE